MLLQKISVLNKSCSFEISIESQHVFDGLQQWQ